MAAKPVEVGPIGGGKIVTRRHRRGLANIKGVAVLAVCNRRPESTKQRATNFGVSHHCGGNTVFILLLSFLVFGSQSVLAAFPDGVCSGDVTEEAAVLWTRTAQPIPVRLEVAMDDLFTSIVASAEGETTEENGLTLRIDVVGLAPLTTYHFRFVNRAEESDRSPPGRFRTAPAPGESAAFRFVFSGDSDFAYTPLWIMKFAADESPDFGIWFGDTIYGDVPSGGLGLARTLDEYRAKYRQIRADEHMREFLRTVPVWVGWDDHEVVNDYAGGDPEPPLTREQIINGYQAFFENMPIRPQGVSGDEYRTYRRLRYGSLAELFLLDVRQYRDRSAAAECDMKLDPHNIVLGGRCPAADCLELLRQPRTMLGEEQLSWLKSGLLDSQADIKVVVVGVPMTFMALLPYDRWDGYGAERREILEFIDANMIESVWFLATDAHLTLFNPDLTSYFRRHRPDYQLPNAVVMPEIVAGPIAAGTPLREATRMGAEILGLEPDCCLLSTLLNGPYEWMTEKLLRLNELAFLDADRFAYVLIEVSEAGDVDLTFRGIDPQAHQQDEPRLRTTFTTVPAEQAAPPCFFAPVVPLALCGAVLLARRFGRHA